MPLIIIRDAGGMVIKISRGTVSYNPAGKSPADFFVIFYVAVNDKRSVIRKQFRKLAERMADVLQILEKIKMIFLDVQYNADFREKMKKTVGIFAGFRDKCAGTSNPDIPSDCFQNTAYGYSGIQIPGKKDVRDHRSCGCLAVRPGYRDGCVIIFHKLSQQFSPGKHGNFSGYRFNQLRIAAADCCCIYHAFNSVCDIFGLLPVKNVRAFRLKLTGQRRFF